MGDSQLGKRKRKTNQSSYHDSIPTSGDYTRITAREERLVRVNRVSVLPGVPAVTENYEQEIPSSWADTLNWGPPDDANFALDPDGDAYNYAVEANPMDSSQAAPTTSTDNEKKKKSERSRRPNIAWKNIHRETYLDEMLRWEGRGDFAAGKVCPDCSLRKTATPGPPEYRCAECFVPDLVCDLCCVKRHRRHPLHRIERWTGTYFTPSSLKELGLEVQLGHASLHCEAPADCHASMLVLHVNGIHEVNIKYCNCTRAIPQHIQLLQRGFYPSSQLIPKTCATFELLQHLHMVALTTKASTYDLYRALEKLTNNTGIRLPKSRYRSLFRIFLQWRHLKLLKRGGRGHDVTGAAGTKDGELAVLCPSCPRPGINIPDDWEKAPPNLKFLYMVILCMDANFRLKNQVVSNHSQDPGLGGGWAYMLPRNAYEEYVKSRIGADEDISTCVGLQALAKAHTKYCEGLRYTGVGAVCCGRSEMLVPVGIGNLQKGERYSNMDYIFGSALQSVAVLLVLISYDIACQWFVNLQQRIDTHWPSEVKPKAGVVLAPAIPKLHEAMHDQSKNHKQFSLNCIPGVGNSDCECPERIWGPHNVLGNSTKLQGPGTRSDNLDDNWGFWNWLKYNGLGLSLARKFKAAVTERNVQGEGHRGLTASINNSDLIQKWEKMCVDWEQAPFPKKDKTNPYEALGIELTEKQVRQQLAEEEAKRLASGGIARHTTSAAVFVTLALELEESQRRVSRLAKVTTKNATALQKASLLEQRNTLRSRLKTWEQLCPIYMPGLLQYLTNLNTSGDGTASLSSAKSNPEDAQLWLPSRIPLLYRAQVCVDELPDIEERLRTVQCYDALNSVRHTLRIKSRLIVFKNKNLRGQRDGTRSRAVIDRIHGRVRAYAAKYRAARAAKLALTGPGEWETALRELHDADIRSYQDANKLKPKTGRKGTLEDDIAAEVGSSSRTANVTLDISVEGEDRTRRDGTGESRRTLSWIWLSTPIALTSLDNSDNILQSEWARSRARSMRATEEVQLLKEEMRRVIAFCRWKADWWRKRAKIRQDIDDALAEGLTAYSEDQAAIQEALADEFNRLWTVPLSATDDLEGEKDEESSSEDEDGGQNGESMGHLDDDDDDDPEPEMIEEFLG